MLKGKPTTRWLLRRARARTLMRLIVGHGRRTVTELGLFVAGLSAFTLAAFTKGLFSGLITLGVALLIAEWRIHGGE